MILNLLDIAPISSWEQNQRAEARKKAELEKKQQEELLKEQEKAEKKAEKAKKAKKKAEKAKKKAEKAKKKAEKAEKKAKKAEKRAQKDVKNLSQATCAAMPTGIVLAVCASLLVCCGSAWFFRRFNSGQATSKS
jgi:cobalamin biosynthesis Mg chelatase CobN